MQNLRIVIVALAMAVNGPALADKMFAVTPSNAAEMVFAEKPTSVLGQLSGKCIDSRWTVVSSNSNELVCEAPMNMGQSILGQMLMGNSYSTPPRRFFRFNIAEMNGISRVQASGWMELQMAFGQMKRTDFSGPEFQNSIMNFLAAAGGKYPVGTTFPNHVFMGVQIADVPQGKYVGLRIGEATANGAAANAGIQIGDILTSIAQKRFKNAGDFLDATAKAAESPTYEVELVRSGSPMKVKLERIFRPSFSEAIIAKAEPTAPPAQPSTQLSVADELLKLAKLKNDGLLTDDEFTKQKMKLLGQ